MATLSKDKAVLLEVQKRVKETVQYRMESIVNGHSAMDFATLKYNIGFINGLKELSELIEEAEKYVDEQWR